MIAWGNERNHEMREKKTSKPATVCAVLICMLVILGAVGVRTFLAPCLHEDGSFGSCHWAGNALFGLFILMGIQALAVLSLSSLQLRQGLILGLLGESLYGLLLPGLLIRLCSMATMRCQSVMKPGASVIFVLVAILAVIAAVLCQRGRKDGHS